MIIKVGFLLHPVFFFGTLLAGIYGQSLLIAVSQSTAEKENRLAKNMIKIFLDMKNPHQILMGILGVNTLSLKGAD